MSTIYDTFVMEIRPRLQSCNVYFILKPGLNDQLRISLKSNEIHIVSNGEVQIIPVKRFNILVNSLSCLQVSGSFLSFRFQTQNLTKTTGRFTTELVMYELEDSFSSLGISNNNTKIVKDLGYILKCGNCKNNLSDTINFNRVLPLPSENAEPQDWFCHKSEELCKFSFNPNENDCFYSNCYIRLNHNIFNNVKLTQNDIIVCKRCLSWLGLKINTETFQVWFNTVILESDQCCIYSNALSDFILSVRTDIKELVFGPCKVLFECRNLNCTDFLCVWVLEKSLEVIIKGQNFKSDKSGSQKVAKVLFYFCSEKDSIIGDWLDDSNVSNVKISKQMMVKGLNHLFEMSKLVPSCFRMSNNFYVSYIVL